METTKLAPVDRLFAESEAAFEHWEVNKDLVDEMIDLTLNYRQSGHPGGSRSKVHLLLGTLLSGAMNWDIRQPWRRFQDRFVLSAGHTVPLVYATLAVLNETLRVREECDGEKSRFGFPDGGRWALTWEQLPGLRHRGGLPGHAEMAGRSLFLKFNTGPSGHGMPPAAGEALALKMAGAENVKVFAIEGEGGLTPGGSAETRNNAWGMGLSNLVFLIDWNDFGIDDTPISAVVPGTPETWFASYGWKVNGTLEGMEWGPVTRAVLEAARGENPDRVPCAAWVKTRKGRNYGKVDNKSHGVPHAMNVPEFWAVRKEFMAKYGVTYEGVDQPAPADPAEVRKQADANLRIAISVLRARMDTTVAISDRLLELASRVPEEIATFNLGGKGAAIFDDKRFWDYRNYPAEMYKKPGEKQPNRAALAAWGSWVNAIAKRDYGRPLFIAASADLAESTNLAGFAKPWDDLPGFGWYNRDSNTTGALLPTEITEFTNAGMLAGMASVNLAEDPFHAFNGYYGACSTYGSFAYLKYGPLRLFSQLAQDCDLKVGKILWVAGHSGPETADDSRTHFGIFETAVTTLFPEGAVIDLHPWEYNEVPVVLGAAFQQKAPIVALHLTRPPIELPDREALGMASHLEAAKGAYLIRGFTPGKPALGTVFVQGTTSTANVVKLLPEIEKAGLNVKIVAAISPQLFRLQPASYQASIISMADRMDGMAITNRAFRQMREWVDSPIADEYSLSADWDNRWRTGGTLDEVIEEAHLTTKDILAAIERFVRERDDRMRRLREAVESAATRR